MEGKIIQCRKSQYKILKFIGSGAFAKVYLTKLHDRQDDCSYAVKIIKTSTEQESMAVINEYELHQKIRHDNIVRMVDFGSKANQNYLVMEYCQSTLADAMQQGLSEERIFNIFFTLVKTVEFVHSKKITHRDLKPQNILMAGETIKISDFGISKFKQMNSMHATAIGTPNYMAPQSLIYQLYSRLNHLMQIRALLFEMCYGQTLFPNATTVIAIQNDYDNLKEEAIKYPQKEISAFFKRIIQKLLKYEESQRAELREIIEEFQLETKKEKNIQKMQICSPKIFLKNLRKTQQKQVQQPKRPIREVEKTDKKPIRIIRISQSSTTISSNQQIAKSVEAITKGSEVIETQSPKKGIKIKTKTQIIKK